MKHRLLLIPALLVCTSALAADPLAQLPNLPAAANTYEPERFCPDLYAAYREQMNSQRSALKERGERFGEDNQQGIQAEAMADMASMMPGGGGDDDVMDLDAVPGSASSGMALYENAMATQKAEEAAMQCTAKAEGHFNQALEKGHANAETAFAKRLSGESETFLAAARDCAIPKGGTTGVDNACMGTPIKTYVAAKTAAGQGHVEVINKALAGYVKQTQACLSQRDAAYAKAHKSKPLTGKAMAMAQEERRFEEADKISGRLERLCRDTRGVMGYGDLKAAARIPGKDELVIVFRSYSGQNRNAEAAPSDDKKKLGEALKKGLGSLFGN